MPAAPGPQIALAPTLHPQQAGFIDYGTKEGQKRFAVPSAELNLENKFDGKGMKSSFSSKLSVKGQILLTGHKKIMIF